MQKQLFTKLTALAAVALLATAFVPRAAEASIALPPQNQTVAAVIAVDLECSNSPGPEVVITGFATIGTFSVTVGYWQNKNKNGELTLVEAVDVEVGFKDPVVWAKQRFTGNPEVLGQLLDADGNVIVDWVSFGKCVGGQKKRFYLTTPIDLVENLLVASVDCRNHPGPQITIGGAIKLRDGVKLKLKGRNNAKETHVRYATVDALVLDSSYPLEDQVVVPKQISGGNPVISVDGVRLGRCNQLSSSLLTMLTPMSFSEYLAMTDPLDAERSYT
jgi:hypothetical protein